MATWNRFNKFYCRGRQNKNCDRNEKRLLKYNYNLSSSECVPVRTAVSINSFELSIYIKSQSVSI